MEFGEKLEKLRKNRGLTQEELAQFLFVSRTAISKWESGRGYPSIDSIKQISKFFAVTIDELLLGEELISIAEKENKANLKKLYGVLFGVLDLLNLILIFLPLYPNLIDGVIYSVNFFSYSNVTLLIKWLMFGLYIFLILIGGMQILLTFLFDCKWQKLIIYCSLAVATLTVLFLGITREVYAIAISFIFLIIKVVLFFRQSKG